MLDGLIYGLFVSWLLSWFGFDEIVSNCIKETFGYNFTSNQYYVIAGIIGVVSALVSK